jgi:uncharacterized protein
MTTCIEGAAPPLYDATVPVLDAVLDRLAMTLAQVAGEIGSERLAVALTQRPAPGMLTSARQLATAAQFTLRIAWPLAGRRPPELRGGFDEAGLAQRLAAARARLAELAPEEFAGAETRMVRFQAGFADLELPGADFLHRFGLPNLYFHQAMAHIALKQAGATLGKAHFDGIHSYPPGFSLG